jgi:hypothetical protein
VHQWDQEELKRRFESSGLNFEEIENSKGLKEDEVLRL